MGGHVFCMFMFCEHVYVYAQVYGGQRATLSVPRCFLSQFSMNLNLADSATLAGHGAPV